MNHAVDILTIVTFGIALLGGCVRAVSKLTRIADSVDRLSASMEHVVTQIGDHETRLDKLEAKPARTRARSAG